jgi:hypothetical protein
MSRRLRKLVEKNGGTMEKGMRNLFLKGFLMPN